MGSTLVMGGAAIGAGEWMAGPLTTAKYGGAILWLSTLSILGQVVYNLEISRYTLYSGESIFTGKFRLLPGPFFWLALYLLLDFGSVFPYIASAAATPLAAVMVVVANSAAGGSLTATELPLPGRAQTGWERKRLAVAFSSPADFPVAVVPSAQDVPAR